MNSLSTNFDHFATWLIATVIEISRKVFHREINYGVYNATWTKTFPNGLNETIVAELAGIPTETDFLKIGYLKNPQVFLYVQKDHLRFHEHLFVMVESEWNLFENTGVITKCSIPLSELDVPVFVVPVKNSDPILEEVRTIYRNYGYAFTK